MSRLELRSPNQAQLVVEGLLRIWNEESSQAPPGLCPVDMFFGDLSCTELWKVCSMSCRTWTVKESDH